MQHTRQDVAHTVPASLHVSIGCWVHWKAPTACVALLRKYLSQDHKLPRSLDCHCRGLNITGGRQLPTLKSKRFQTSLQSPGKWNSLDWTIVIACCFTVIATV